MSEWIEQMRSHAKKKFRTFVEGDLCGGSEQGVVVLAYVPKYDANEVSLEGDFTIEQLQDIVNHMNQYKGE